MRTNQTRKFKLFRPIVASSLALVLGSGSVYGGESIESSCGGDGNCNQVMGNITFQWGDVSNGKFEVTTSNQDKFVTFKDGTINQVTLKDTSFQNGHIFTDSGSHTMTIDFKTINSNGNRTDTSRAFTFNAENLFTGNLLISGIDNNNSLPNGFSDKITFTADLKQGMKGNIEVQGNGKHTINLNGQTIEGNIRSNVMGGNLTIKDGLLKGNIGGNELGDPENTKDLHITLEDFKMEGNIQSAANDFQRRNVVFTASKTPLNAEEDYFVLTGNIVSNGTGYSNHLDTNNGNYVIFEVGSMKGDILANGQTSFGRAGYNKVEFKSTGAKLKGNIGGNFVKYGDLRSKNEVIFSGSSSILDGDIDSQANVESIVTFTNGGVITGDVKASTTSTGGSAINKVTFSGIGTNTIQGKVTSNKSTNIVVFNSLVTDSAPLTSEAKNEIKGGVESHSGTNEIIFENIYNGATSISNSITGDILASGGSNTISFEAGSRSSLGKNSITANITADGGNNYITFGSGSQHFQGENTYSGNILAGTGGYEGQNYLYFSGSSTSINGSSSIKAYNQSNTNTWKINKLKFASNTNSLTLDLIEANKGATINYISLDGNSNTLSVNTISAINGQGKNFIGKGILTGESASNLTPSEESLTAFSGTISVNSITASGGGQNTIKVDSSALEHVGFDSLGQRVGANTIGSIVANEGNNTIEIKGTSTIGSITTSGGKNTITLDGTSAQRSITQEISSTGGVNAIILKGTDANLITLESTLSASGRNAKNAIGSVDLSEITNDGFNFQDSARTGIASQAFQGTLEIKRGIKGTNGGWNNIAFKATNLQTQSVISAREEGTAISGNVNLYLDVSEAGFGTVGSSPSSKPAISGNVVLGSGETANLYIKGKSSQAELYSASSITTQTIGLDGNLENTSGNMNLIFEDALWNPYGMITGVDLATSETSGKVTNKGGNVNIVFRKSDTSLALPASLDQTPSLPAFKVINEGGNINIIMQGQTAVSSYITYGSSSTTNLIFANTSSGTDSFASAETADNKILGRTYQDGVKLSLQDKQISIGDSQNVSFIDTYKQYFANTTINEKDSLLNITTTRSKSGTTQTDQIYVKGLAVGDISELAPSQQKDGVSYIYNVVLGKDSAFVGNIALQADSKVNLIMEQGSKLLTDSKDLKIQNLAINGNSFDRSEILKGTFEQKNTIIDIASMGSDLGQLKSRNEFRLLTIGTKEVNAGILASGVKTTGLTGSSALFRVYMNNKSGDGSLGESASYSDKQYGYVYSDRILVLSGSHQNSKEEAQPHYIQVIADSQTDISQVKYNGGGTEVEGNVAVATVKTSTGIKFEGASQKQGFDIIGTTLTAVSGTDEYGKIKNDTTSSGSDSEESVVSSSSVSSGSSSTSTDYTTYFVDKMTSKGAGEADRQASAQAMGLNYELFLANFNSLNKRMGELRNNDHSQGAWGRIFNGMLESNFALKSKTIYTTIQAGYDYAFGFEGANNYLGLALSYANAIVDPENMTDLYGQSGVEKATQHGVELAVYNSYVQDEGWFNDAIAKFSFITSNINMIGQSSTYNSNNWGAVLSDEFGYRFKLGETKEWYIDPQVELGFGYFNQSNLKQVLGQASLTGIQKEILTLRTRAGATWGYDFKNFTEGKKIKASLYLGTYYSYDYIAGGEIDLETNLKVKSQTFRILNSTGRFDLNVGTNIQLQDNIRVYADFERSFGGDLTTLYQVNLGVRYSFGEGTYTPKPMLTQEKETLQAPVKLEEKDNQQDDLGGGVNNQNSQTSIQEEASNEVEEAPKTLIQEDIISQKEISPKPLQQESLPQKPDTQEVFSPQEMITHQSELTIQEDSSMLETEILQEIAELEELTEEEKAISKTVFYQKLTNDIKKFEVSAKRNLDTFKRLFFWQNF